VDGFKEWIINEFVPEYEQRTGRELHTLWDPDTETHDDNKYSGMMQCFGELTSFAAITMTKDRYKSKTRTRITKGIKYEYGDPYEPYKPSKRASFPPEFPQAVINYLASHKSE
jgi:hypothetical protein